MQTTMGRPVIMGRKTFESMKAPLPGRTNIVLTQNPDWQRDGVQAVATLERPADSRLQKKLERLANMGAALTKARTKGLT